MLNLKKRLALPSQQKMIALTVTRAGRTTTIATTVKDNKEIKSKLV